MLIHQLLKEIDFKELCVYCGHKFQLDAPEFSRSGEKEYVTIACDHGHRHTFSLDMSRVFDAKLIHRDIDTHKKLPTKPLEKVVIEH